MSQLARKPRLKEIGAVYMKARGKKLKFGRKSAKFKGIFRYSVRLGGGEGVRSSKLESMGIRYVFEHIFMDFLSFCVFSIFFRLRTKSSSTFS